MIRITDLHFRYPRGDFALHIPALHIEAATRTAFIGPSGSGKTTLLNLLAGIALPASGQLQVAGRQVAMLSDTARRAFRIRNIGFVFQDFELLDYLTILDNILHPYRISGALKLTPAVVDRAVALAANVGLTAQLRRRPGELSHGEKQRAAVCRALLTEPKLILADEPTGNLDPANKDRILRLLVDYVRDSRATLVAVTHDLGTLEHFEQVIDFAGFHSGVAP